MGSMPGGGSNANRTRIALPTELANRRESGACGCGASTFPSVAQPRSGLFVSSLLLLHLACQLASMCALGHRHLAALGQPYAIVLCNVRCHYTPGRFRPLFAGDIDAYGATLPP